MIGPTVITDQPLLQSNVVDKEWLLCVDKVK